MLCVKLKVKNVISQNRRVYGIFASFSQESRQITKVNCVKKGYNRRSPRGWLEHEETQGKREDLRPGSPAHI